MGGDRNRQGLGLTSHCLHPSTRKQDSEDAETGARELRATLSLAASHHTGRKKRNTQNHAPGTSEMK